MQWLIFQTAVFPGGRRFCLVRVFGAVTPCWNRFMNSAAGMLQAAQKSSISKKSTARSPISDLHTYDCGLPSFLARASWLNPASSRMSRSRARKRRYLGEYSMGGTLAHETNKPKLGYLAARLETVAPWSASPNGIALAKRAGKAG